LRIVALAALLCMPAVTAAAQEHGRPGPYAGVEAATGTATRFRKEYESASGADGGRVDTSVGVGGRVGYRLNARLAVEAQFEWLPGFDYVKNVSEAPGTSSQRATRSRDEKLFDADLWLVTANAKLYGLTTGRFQPYLLGGVGYARSRADEDAGPQGVADDAFAARMGIGFDAYLTRWLLVAVDVQYVRPTGDLDVFDYVHVGAGLQYRY
jgi:opacity protein-like surface antigen